MSFQLSNLKAGLFICITAISVYLPALWFGFSPMDDKWILLDNIKFMSDLHHLPVLFSSGTLARYYRPVFTSSLLIDQVIGNSIGQLIGIGPNAPWIFHLTNILLHGLCCILVFRLFSLFDLPKPAAFFYALVFALHPINVQTVAWIPGRNDSLLCLFSLLSVYFLVTYLRQQRPLYLLIHIGSFCLALLTKENAIVLPILFAVLFFALSDRHLSQIRKLSLLWILLTVTWFFLRKSIGDVVSSAGGSFTPARFVTFFSALVIYVGKCVLPIQQCIVPTVGNTSLFPAIAIVVLIFLFLIRYSVKNKGLATLGIVWFFLFISLPAWVGSSNDVGEQYEHRIYSSLVGILLFFSQINFQWVNKKILLLVVVSIPLAFAAKTVYRSRAYATELQFAQTAAEETPQVALLNDMEGLQFQKNKNYERAITCFSKAIQLNSNKGEYYNNRGACYFILKNYPLAIADYNKTIQFLTSNGDAYLNLSMAYYLSGDRDQAKNQLRQAMKYRAKSLTQGYIDAVYSIQRK